MYSKIWTRSIPSHTLRVQPLGHHRCCCWQPLFQLFYRQILHHPAPSPPTLTLLTIRTHSQTSHTLTLLTICNPSPDLPAPPIHIVQRSRRRILYVPAYREWVGIAFASLHASTILQDLWTYHYYSLNAFSDISPIMHNTVWHPLSGEIMLLLVTVGCSASSNILWWFTLSRCTLWVVCTCTWTIAALVNLWPWVSSISDYACYTSYTSWALHSIFSCWHEIEFQSQVIQWCCTSG